MVNIRNFTCVLLFAAFLSGCGSKPEIPHFNESKWKEDKKGCKGLRVSEYQAIVNAKKDLQGFSETDLVKTTGLPDETYMYKRNIKNLIYYVEPGGQCGTNEKKGRKLIIELNAIGYVTWIYEEM
jgi:hypothetical protein